MGCRESREEALKAAQASTHRKTSFEEGSDLVEGEKLPYRQDGPVTVRILDNTSKPSFNPSGAIPGQPALRTLLTIHGDHPHACSDFPGPPETLEC